VAVEAGIGLSAAFNSLLYVLGEEGRPPYRVAGGALLLVCLGPLAGSALLLAAAARGEEGWTGDPLWAGARALALAGMAAISLLIIRRSVSLGG